LEPVGVATRQSTDVVALADARITEAVRFVRENADQRITVDDLLRVVPMSRTAFEKRFRAALGCTPHEHIQRVRIQRVKSLLVTTDLTLAAIAERAGFEHADYMGVAFKRAVGTSPGVFRNNNRG
jgi:LacI family transcriptional regulator